MSGDITGDKKHNSKIYIFLCLIYWLFIHFIGTTIFVTSLKMIPTFSLFWRWSVLEEKIDLDHFGNKFLWT